MAKAKLQQIKLTAGGVPTQPPFPGGWVLAVFDALSCFAPALAAKHELPTRPRSRDRIRAGEAVKQCSYDKIKAKLVELIIALFPKVSVVNGFAEKYVEEYFRLWRHAVEWSPHFVKCLGLEPSETSVLGRALVRDLVLRLCYLESCERRLSKSSFSECELALLRHDSPAQVYQALISEQARFLNMSQERLAEQLKTDDRTLRRIKAGDYVPPFELLRKLKPPGTDDRLLAAVGFVDQLLRKLKLDKSVLRNEFLSIASVFFRYHPAALDGFQGKVPHKTDSGEIREEVRDFEGFITFGDYPLLHPGWEKVYPEMPDALWRCHLYTLRFSSIMDLGQAYCQLSNEETDAPLEEFLRKAEDESDDCSHAWRDKLQLRRVTSPLPPTGKT
jgi:hypothetical protein